MCLIAQSCLTLCNLIDYTRLLCPWHFSSNNMRVDCHFLLEGIFLTQGLNPHPMQEMHGMGVQPLGQEDSLQQEMAIHSHIIT